MRGGLWNLSVQLCSFPTKGTFVPSAKKEHFKYPLEYKKDAKIQENAAKQPLLDFDSRICFKI